MRSMPTGKELETYEPASDMPTTVSGYAEDFHRLRESSFGSPLSFQREEYDVRHIRELFGDMPLGALRPDEIKRAYAEAISTGRSSEARDSSYPRQAQTGHAGRTGE